MDKPDYNSPTSLKKFLEENDFAMQKKFGQNFLVNENARERLVTALEISGTSKVWEIGPGLGAMTEKILSSGAKLTAFEIDKGFVNSLSCFFDSAISSGQFKIVQGDVIRTWQNELANEMPDRFFGNLPYNIAAALVADTIEKGIRFEKCVLTIQKEVAERMCAKHNTEFYSSFSVLCQWAYNVKPLFDLAGGNFWPKPDVLSRAVVMTPRSDFPKCKNSSHFIKMQRALFSMRRKNLRNTLTAFLSDGEKAESALSKCGIDLRTRAEQLPIETFLQLSDVLNNDIM